MSLNLMVFTFFIIFSFYFHFFLNALYVVHRLADAPSVQFPCIPMRTRLRPPGRLRKQVPNASRRHLVGSSNLNYDRLRRHGTANIPGKIHRGLFRQLHSSILRFTRRYSRYRICFEGSRTKPNETFCEKARSSRHFDTVRLAVLRK